jgi:hypothetical protein
MKGGKMKGFSKISILFLICLPFAFCQSKLKGPIDDVVGSPYIIVYSSPSEDAEDAKAIREFAEALKNNASPSPSAIKEEAGIGSEDIRNFNIVLITIFRHSSLINKLRDSLPIKIEDDAITCGKRTYRGNVGVAFIYPNPLNPSKYLAVFGATNRLALNHLGDVEAYFGFPIDYFIFSLKSEQASALVEETGIFNKEGDKWSLYPGAIPLDKVRWDWNPKRLYKGALRRVTYNIIPAFPQDALIIYGTQGDKEENEYVKEQALKWRDKFITPWGARVDVKADKDVGNYELKNKNLVIFGTIKGNAILSAMKDSLPIRFQGKFIVGKLPHTGERTGIAMAFPNPFNKEKFVLVYSGVTYLGINGDFPTLSHTDYEIYRNSPDGAGIYFGRHEECILEIGWFDKSDSKNWKLK